MRISRPLKLVLVAALLAGAALAALTAGRGGSEDPASTPAAVYERAGDPAHDHAGDPAHTQPAQTRTLVLHTGAEPAPSAHPRHLRALLIRGRVPRRMARATVMTDKDCEPDAQGVSHCRNRLRLAGGRTITVRHPHRMADVPCMTPGETVRVVRA